MRAFNKVVMGGAKMALFTSMMALTYEASIDKLEEHNFIDIQDTYKYTNTPQTQGNLAEAYSNWKQNAQAIPDIHEMGVNEIADLLQSWTSEKNSTNTQHLNTVFLMASMQAITSRF